MTLPGACARLAVQIASASPNASAILRRWRRDQWLKNAERSTFESTAFSSTATAAMISAVSEVKMVGRRRAGKLRQRRHAELSYSHTCDSRQQQLSHQSHISLWC